jgi:hypothetical protein
MKSRAALVFSLLWIGLSLSASTSDAADKGKSSVRATEKEAQSSGMKAPATPPRVSPGSASPVDLKRVQEGKLERPARESGAANQIEGAGIPWKVLAPERGKTSFAKPHDTAQATGEHREDLADKAIRITQPDGDTRLFPGMPLTVEYALDTSGFFFTVEVQIALKRRNPSISYPLYSGPSHPDGRATLETPADPDPEAVGGGWFLEISSPLGHYGVSDEFNFGIPMNPWMIGAGVTTAEPVPLSLDDEEDDQP